MMHHPLTLARIRATDVPSIRPALSREQWLDAYEPVEMAPPGFQTAQVELAQAVDHGQWHKAVALANAALPDSDPRKLTPEHVRQLHVEGGLDTTLGDPERGAWKLALAATIEALLPPWALSESDPGTSNAYGDLRLHR